KAELLRGTYLCLENGGLEQKEIIHLLGLKKSTYYNRLEEAIEDLSRILFGAYGARADILGEAGEEQRQNK
ncbi:MAG: hypothetical protein RR661_00965, partial [Anaerovoracaceae bacterium]